MMSAAALLLPGCLVIGGSRNITESPTKQPATIGQQLVDLGAARDMGVITQAEFEIEKAKLLAGPGCENTSCPIAVEGIKISETGDAPATTSDANPEAAIPPASTNPSEN